MTVLISSKGIQLPLFPTTRVFAEDTIEAGDGHEFSYDEESPEGPKKWGTLSAEFKLCADGESQSPIDIQVKKAKDEPNDLKKAYKQAPAKLFHRGHNIAVEWQGDAGGIEVNGSTYKLVQCHWHTPSEHTFDGKRQVFCSVLVRLLTVWHVFGLQYK
ncbi:hypothetical protein QVD17_22503 [Tagetes erecta]|uniref:Alpha-carbonic anhydrase domain-containing protein n=1 Tax=Tagetes erecta TaxID=13708 RepID=A0AAD8NTL7_TARER|nr:hypothetical protein QVD17_22503 [Tagetes erecta]